MAKLAENNKKHSLDNDILLEELVNSFLRDIGLDLTQKSLFTLVEELQVVFKEEDLIGMFLYALHQK